MSVVSVRCRSVVPRTGERNRSSRVATIVASSSRPIELNRAAAISIASGSRSTASTIRSTDATSTSADTEPAAAARARSRNRLRAAGRSSGVTGHTRSPVAPSRSRLVARMRTRPGARRDRVDHGGDGVDQVLAVVQHDEGVELTDGAEGRGRVAGVGSDAGGVEQRRHDASGSTIAARSTNAEPSPAWPASFDATSTASRVLPTPPGPTNVTSRARAEQLDHGRHVGGPSDDRRSSRPPRRQRARR